MAKRRSNLTWERAREAAKDAWHRLSHGGGGEEAQRGPGLDLPTSEQDLSMKNSRLETTNAGFDESGRSLDAATAPRAGERGNASALRDDDADLH